MDPMSAVATPNLAADLAHGGVRNRRCARLSTSLEGVAFGRVPCPACQVLIDVFTNILSKLERQLLKLLHSLLPRRVCRCVHLTIALTDRAGAWPCRSGDPTFAPFFAMLHHTQRQVARVDVIRLSRNTSSTACVIVAKTMTAGGRLLVIESFATRVTKCRLEATGSSRKCKKARTECQF